jgi:sarcosine oxidase subunit gamma
MTPTTRTSNNHHETMIDLDKLPRRSPVHDILASHQPEWGTLCDAPIAVRFQSPAIEREATGTLALCDVSPLTKLGVKGSDAESFLTGAGIDVPAEVYQTRELEDGGLIVRLGTDEFLLESGFATEIVPRIAERLQQQTGRAFAIERQDATFLLLGPRATEVFAQTCALDMSAAPRRQLILTRVAGVNCGVLPEDLHEVPAYRLWVDYSYAAGLWDALSTICAELGGTIVGAGCVWPDWC